MAYLFVQAINTIPLPRSHEHCWPYSETEQVQMGDYTSNLGYRYYPNALCLEVGIFAVSCRRRSGVLTERGCRASFVFDSVRRG